MPVLLFPHVAHFLVKAFVPAKNPQTGRINYREVGVKWVTCNLYDPVEREHAHNYYLTLCPWISQADRDKVASEWADIRHAREAKEAEDRKKAQEKRKTEMKKAEEMKYAQEISKALEKEMEKQKAEKKRKVAAMLDESEDVAMTIAQVEKKLKTTVEGMAKKAWLDVVMGD